MIVADASPSSNTCQWGVARLSLPRSRLHASSSRDSSGCKARRRLGYPCVPTSRLTEKTSMNWCRPHHKVYKVECPGLRRYSSPYPNWSLGNIRLDTQYSVVVTPLTTVANATCVACLTIDANYNTVTVSSRTCSGTTFTCDYPNGMSCAFVDQCLESSSIDC